MRGRLGPEENDDKEIVILGRTLKWGDKGISIRADTKHAENIKTYCEIDQNSKSLVGPGKKEESGDVIEVEEEEGSSHIASFDGVGPDENSSGKNAGESDKVLVKCAQLIKEFRGMAPRLITYPRIE